MHKEVGQNKSLLLYQVISSSAGAGWDSLLGSKGRAASICTGPTINNSQASFVSAVHRPQSAIEEEEEFYKLRPIDTPICSCMIYYCTLNAVTHL